MSDDIMAFRVVTAAIGFVLIGKLLFDYFSGSSRLLSHPDARVGRLNRWRVYSVIVFLVSLVVAAPAYLVGLPVTGVLGILGIGIIAMLVCLVCTFRVILVTGRL